MTTARPVRVIVTRPAEQAGPWVERFRERGMAAEALPLIEIAPAADIEALRAGWLALASYRLVVFVSANAVLHFFAARPAGIAWPDGVDAAVPGGGTADALRTAGVPLRAIVTPADDAAQFDSESLWARLQTRDWRGARVLVVRGDGGRDWLAERLVAAGAHVETLSAYRRLAPAFEGAARARLDAAIADGDAVWLFSSSEAIANLEQAAGAGRFHAARAVATHPRIAARARGLGFGAVVEAPPGLDAVIACLQSMQP
ncbi:MAG TPA: uroporphyrinogen-III synthase [Caldimonas sp.]|nr:uroporphyrinogen-III synthase [Caldimonas sp.]